MAYRLTSDSGHRVLVGASQRHRRLARNAALAGAALSCIALIAAGAALFGHGGCFKPGRVVAARPGTLRIAWVDPAAPKVVRRDPRVAIATPGPHLARVAVATVPLPPARPAQVAALAPERSVEETPAPVDKRVEIASAPPVVPLPVARPVQSTSIAFATTAANVRGADPETTGLIGEPVREHARIAAAPHPLRKAAMTAKPARKSFFASLFRPAGTAYEKLYGPVRVASLSYAATGGDDDSGPPHAPFDRQTAVYVIASKKVYMPDGTVFEAHSGYGDKLDDPRFVNVRMRGATPPHMYDLSLRESLFHGVEAIRLTPVGGDETIFERTGLLAHTYMLGPRGDSNGCISFKDYDRFLRAFKAGRISRLAVIARLD